MNVANNKRKKESKQRIMNVFVNELQTRDVKEITVTDICKLADINRSTFYANFIDVYDLVDQINKIMLEMFLDIYKEESTEKKHSYDFLKLFKHIKENQIFYKTFFKLNSNFDKSFFMFDLNAEMKRFYPNSDFIEYHIDFFEAGLNAIIKRWLNTGCKESPEEIESIIKSEYKKRSEL